MESDPSDEAGRQGYSSKLGCTSTNMIGDNARFEGPVVGGDYHIYHQSNQDGLIQIWRNLKASLHFEHEKLQMPKMPWLDWEQKFEDYYVELAFSRKEDIERKNLQLNEIFATRDGKKPYRILVEGPAGYGKSTLALKLCYDHSRGEEYIRHFEAVILLRLREFTETLDELIIDTLMLEGCDPKQVLEAINVNHSQVLFILDGFDEMPEETRSRIVPILLGKRFPKATFLVTSRAASIPFSNQKMPSSITDLVQAMDRRLIIKGINGEDR